MIGGPLGAAARLGLKPTVLPSGMEPLGLARQPAVPARRRLSTSFVTSDGSVLPYTPFTTSLMPLMAACSPRWWADGGPAPALARDMLERGE